MAQNHRTSQGHGDSMTESAQWGPFSENELIYSGCILWAWFCGCVYVVEWPFNPSTVETTMCGFSFVWTRICLCRSR